MPEQSRAKRAVVADPYVGAHVEVTPESADSYIANGWTRVLNDKGRPLMVNDSTPTPPAFQGWSNASAARTWGSMSGARSAGEVDAW